MNDQSTTVFLFKHLAELDVCPGWCFYELKDFDDFELERIPKPVLAVVMVYPAAIDFLRPILGVEMMETELYSVQQVDEYACATVAMLHAIVNNRTHIRPKCERISFDVLSLLVRLQCIRNLCNSSWRRWRSTH